MYRKAITISHALKKKHNPAGNYHITQAELETSLEKGVKG
jgi:hypothetical protein